MSTPGALAPPGHTVSMTPFIKRTERRLLLSHCTFVVPIASEKHRMATTRNPFTVSESVPLPVGQVGSATEHVVFVLSLIVM